MAAQSSHADHLALPNIAHFLEADPDATFLIPIDLTTSIAFELLFSNNAFKAIDGIVDLLHADNSDANQFRSWSQAVAYWREEYDFAGRTWTAFSIQGRWKAMRSKEQSPSAHLHNTLQQKPISSSLDDTAHLMKNARIDERLENIQTIMEMSDVGVFEFSPSGTLLRANEAWYNLSLHPREDDVHKDFSFMDLVYPPDVPLVMAHWNKLMQGLPITFEMRWKAPKQESSQSDKEEFQWILSSTVPVMDKQGKLTSVAGNTIDISAQKRIQNEALQRAEALERARTSEQKFARFAELAPVGIYIFDAAKGMQYCNPQFFELTGHPRVEPKEVDWIKLVLPEDLGIVEEGWRVLLQDKERYQTQFRLRRTWEAGNGEIRQAWAQGQSFPECDADGNVISILGTLIDISRFKWAEDVQRSRTEEALEAKRQQENFIDMTSHEMRNPLSVVMLSADSSIDAVSQISSLTLHVSPHQLHHNLKKVEEEINTAMDALQTIISCSLHQKRVIDDLLTLSKLDSNLLLITPVRVKPAMVVADAVKMFEVECAKQNMSLTFFEDPSLSSTGADWVMMDPSRLVQILINLLTNAIKFSSNSKEKTIRVIVGASPTVLPEFWNGIEFAASNTISTEILDKEEWGEGAKAYIWITVEDAGCGITPAELGNLFTRFSQASPRTHVQYGGSGLGLFISKSLVELQSGCIGVKSEADVGSTFAFYVGSRITSSPDAKIIDGPIPFPESRRTQSLEEVVKAAHYSVLIVEDNLVNQRILSRQLQKLGCNVHVTGQGEEALEFLKTTKLWHTQVQTGQDLSIILMDIEMPVMDGLTCSRHIRKLQSSGEIIDHIPILAVSANARSEQVRQALDVGIDDTIAKPFRIPELLLKLDLLARKQ